MSGKPSDADNAALLAALRSYAKDQDLAALDAFVKGNPTSPWAVSVLTNLGLLKFAQGYFSVALANWQQAWELGKADTDPTAQALVNRALAELIKMDCRVGRKDEAKALLKEVEFRSFHGLTSSLISNSRQAVLVMENLPAECFKCGPFALRNILTFEKQQTPPALSKIKDYATTAQGTSLAQVEALSGQIGMKMQVARRISGSELPLPAVVHWKLDHYGALLKAKEDGYFLADPTFGVPTWVLKDAVATEGSGYFLIPAGPLPKGWVKVSKEEAGTIWGRGFVTEGTPEATTPNDASAGGKDDCKGMAQWSFHTMLASLNIRDMPISYQPPIGPAVECIVNYDAKEQNQPSVIHYANLGPLWNLSWQSSIVFAGGRAYVSMGTGGSEVYSNFNEEKAMYDPDIKSKCLLVRTVNGFNPTFERRAPDGSRMIFSLYSGERLFLTETVDAHGNKVTLTYDNKYRLLTIKDASGQISKLSYGSSVLSSPLYYRVTRFTDPFGRFAAFSYNAEGLLIEITDQLGLKSKFNYGENDFISDLITPYGTTHFTYSVSQDGNVTSLVATEPNGAVQRLDSVVDTNSLAGFTSVGAAEPAVPEGMAVTNEYLNYRNSFYWDRKAMNDAPGDYTKAQLTHFMHDVTGVLKGSVVESTKAPLENRVWFNYQGVTNPIFMYEGMRDNPVKIGRVLDDGTTQLDQFTYNDLGNVTQTIDAVGRTTNYTYAANNIDLLTVKRVVGSSSSQLLKYTYNSLHEVVTYADAAGQPSTFTYNPQGQMLSMTNAKGETIAYAYDIKGYLTSIDGPLSGTGDRTLLTYDAFGRMQTMTNGDGYAIAATYDALDRLIKLTYPDGTYAEATYTNLDMTQMRDRMGRITTYAFNSVQQLTSVTDPLLRVTAFEWCSCGSLKKMVDPMGRITRWEQDFRGRPTTKTYADGTTETYIYEASTSRLKGIKDGKGQIRSYTYNRDNTPAAIDYLNAEVATPSVKMTYDPSFKRILTMTDGIGKTTYAYNNITPVATPGAGQLAKITGPLANSTVNYAYDQLGRVVSRTVNGQAQTWSHDAVNRIPGMTNVLGTFAYTYDGVSGRVKTATAPNGVVTALSYFPSQSDFRLNQVTHKRGATLLTQYDYTQNANGLPTTWSQKTGTAAATNYSFTYDAVGQLLSAIATGDSSTYVYDAIGNRTSQTINGVTTKASYTPGNSLLTVSPPLANEKTYSWDAEGRLVGIAYSGTTKTTALKYDGMGRCTEIVEKTGTTINSTKRFVWAEWSRAEERNASNVVTRRFFSQGEQIGATKYYYTNDHLGNIREMRDASGNLAARYSYDFYGNRTRTAGTVDASMGYTGHYYHAPSGLVMAPKRNYDPQTGRWISRDSMQEGGGLNLYAYVGNSPVAFMDPTGNVRWLDAGLAVAGLIGNGAGAIGAGSLAIATGGTSGAFSGAVALKSAYGYWDSVVDLSAAIYDEEPVTKGSALNDLVAYIGPCDEEFWQSVATAADLGTDLVTGRIAGAARRVARMGTIDLTFGIRSANQLGIKRIPVPSQLEIPMFAEYSMAGAGLFGAAKGAAENFGTREGK